MFRMSTCRIRNHRISTRINLLHIWPVLFRAFCPYVSAHHLIIDRLKIEPRCEMNWMLAADVSNPCRCFLISCPLVSPQEVLSTSRAERSSATAETPAHLSTGWRGISLSRILTRNEFKKATSSKSFCSWSSLINVLYNNQDIKPHNTGQ